VSGARKLRVAAVSFLNARPITYGLERGLGADRFELSFELPSRWRAAAGGGRDRPRPHPDGRLRRVARPAPRRARDRHRELRPVRTVLLVSDVPWTELDEIALDGASRSSAALLKLLCRERGLAPRFREVPHDAVLAPLRGGRARSSSATPGSISKWDPQRVPLPPRRDPPSQARRLPTRSPPRGTSCRRSRRGLARDDRLPFVYAVWAGRPEALGADEIGILQQSVSEGMIHRAEIARAWAEAAPAGSGAPALYERYLTENIRYRLGAEELSGVAAFFERAHAAGLFAARARLRLYEQAVMNAGGVRRDGRAAPAASSRRARTRSIPSSPTPPRARASHPRTACASTPRRPRSSSAPPPTNGAGRSTRATR